MRTNAAALSANFAQTYHEARSKFLGAADAAELDIHSHPHPMLGRDGEQLAMDVVRDGPADAAALLLISSACHGVEGFCGSGVQTTLLADRAWRAAEVPGGNGQSTAHALARIYGMMAAGGVWEGKPPIGPAAVEAAGAVDGAPPRKANHAMTAAAITAIAAKSRVRRRRARFTFTP